MIRFMHTNDFGISGDGGLLNNIQSGYSFILFYSTRCKHCEVAKQIFAYLGDTVVGCEFGQVNLDENQQLISLCNQTTLKIEYVPLLVFFANGKAYMMYSGPLQEANIRQFIEQVAFAYANENNNSMEIGDKKTMLSDFEGCHMEDEKCKQDYVKRQTGCYVTMKEAYSNRG